MDKELKNKVLLTALNGLEKEDFKEALERIMILVSPASIKQEAYKEALDLRSEVNGLVTVEDINLKHCKAKYGYFKGYPVIQLALDYFQMSNDLFFEKYHFNYVPRGEVFTDVKKMIEDIQLQKSFVSTFISSDVKGLMSIERNLFQNGSLGSYDKKTSTKQSTKKPIELASE